MSNQPIRSTPEVVELGQKCMWDSPEQNSGESFGDEIAEQFVRTPVSDGEGAFLYLSANLVSPGETVYIAPARQSVDAKIGTYGTYVDVDPPTDSFDGWGGADIGLGFSPDELVGRCVKVEFLDGIKPGKYLVQLELTDPNMPGTTLSAPVTVE